MNEILDYRFHEGLWYALYRDLIEKPDGETIDSRDWRLTQITEIPVETLLEESHCLVNELSVKEIELFNNKEAYIIAENKIINETDFKELYSKNNEKVRKEHCKKELSDMYATIKELEWSIDFIRNYIPLIKEVVRSKLR